MARPNEREVLVVKKKIAPEVHGGSAWKVAYADFVTAMMAFFLLLWLLNATTEEQKRGISNYFEPVGATNNSTGSGGLLGGISATDPGPIRIPGQTPTQLAEVRHQEITRKERDLSKGDPQDRIKTPRRTDFPRNTDEERQFDAAKTAIQRAIEQIPELSELYDSIRIEIVKDGMRIRLLDSNKRPLFKPGGTELNETGRKLMQVIAEVVDRMPNQIQVAGFTTPNDEKAVLGTTNWAISIERAYAARKLLAKFGTPDQRFDAVRGAASQMPIDAKQPDAPINRRIEVTLLRQKPAEAAKDLIPPSAISP